VIHRSASARHAVRRPMLLIATATAATALLLSGCAAGEHAATSKEVPVVDAAVGKIGNIGLNATAIIAPSGTSYAAGSNANLQMYLTNSGQSADELLGVSSSGAASVQAFANPAAASATTSSSARSSASAATSSGTTSSSSAATDSSCTPVAGFTPITIPAGGAVPIGYAATQKALVLAKLTNELFPAQSVQVTFDFCHAGTVELSVPVALTPGPSTTPTENIEPSAD
jgi:copper(I)-binding protein